ncbi:MAG: hypothetical protein ACRDD2_08960 [Sarcina sp.]
MSKQSSDSKIVSTFIGILVVISALIVAYITYLFLAGRFQSVTLYVSIVFMCIIPPVSMATFKKIFNSKLSIPQNTDIANNEIK